MFVERAANLERAVLLCGQGQVELAKKKITLMLAGLLPAANSRQQLEMRPARRGE
jgi:hypothetical protein